MRELLAALTSMLAASLIASAAAAHDPGRPGPYEVGFTSFVPIDTTRSTDSRFGGRPVAIGVFYPVDSEDVDASSPPALYPRNPVNAPSPTFSSLLYEGQGIDAAYQAPLPSTAGPFPLVLFSPAWGASWTWYVYFGTRVASHGYAVAIVSHHADSDPRVHVAVTLSHRPVDMSFALTQLLARNMASADLPHGVIDAEHVVAAGHSLGGYTAIALAAGDDDVCDNAALLTGAPPPPGSCVAVAQDSRFEAIATLDGSNQMLRFEELERVGVPSLGLGQDPPTLAAIAAPYGAAWQARQHAAFAGHSSYRVDVLGSRHNPSFSNVCEEVLGRFASGSIGQGQLAALLSIFECYAPGVICRAEAHRIVTQYVIVFLDTVVSGRGRHREVLTPGWALTNEPSVQFFERENGGRESAPRNLGEPEEFRYLASQPGKGHAKSGEHAKRPDAPTHVEECAQVVPEDEQP